MSRAKAKRLMQANTYRVPAKQWRSWPDIAQRVFNEAYSSCLHNQHLFLHPKTKPVPAEQWRTTAWNTAWIAADATKRALDGIIAQTGYQ